MLPLATCHAMLSLLTQQRHVFHPVRMTCWQRNALPVYRSKLLLSHISSDQVYLSRIHAAMDVSS